jgi:hypothetical protein
MGSAPTLMMSATIFQEQFEHRQGGKDGCRSMRRYAGLPQGRHSLTVNERAPPQWVCLPQQWLGAVEALS